MGLSGSYCIALSAPVFLIILHPQLPTPPLGTSTRSSSAFRCCFCLHILFDVDSMDLLTFVSLYAQRLQLKIDLCVQQGRLSS